jgi:MoaA/NifB/PqqE/SkfB family radical SAM enzyme
MASRELLLLDQLNSRLYVLPVDTQGSVTLLSGSVEENEHVRPYLALPSQQLLYADPRAISPFAVPDNDLAGVLERFRVDGLRVASAPALEPDSKALPLFGNLVDPTWLSVQLGGQCDSKCTFCFTEWIRHEPKLTFRQAKRALDEAAQISTVEAVVFTGGEPTIRNDLMELAGYAAACGFQSVALQTNGHRIANPLYLDRIVNAGIQKVLLSLHGARASTHDRIARHPGSFELAHRALIALERRKDVATEVNFVVCPQNKHEAREFVDLVRNAAPAASIRYSFPIVEGAAYDNIEATLPTLESYIEAVTEAVRLAHSRNLRVSTANVPPCVSAAVGLSSNYVLSQRRTMLGVSPFVSSSTRRGELSAKVAACEACTFARDCGGLQLAYLRKFPLAYQHFRPVLDPTRH